MIVENIPFSKTVAALVAQSKHKHAGVRSKIALFLAYSLESDSNIHMKDLEKMIPTIAQFLQDGNSDTRAYGR